MKADRIAIPLLLASLAGTWAWYWRGSAPSVPAPGPAAPRPAVSPPAAPALDALRAEPNAAAAAADFTRLVLGVKGAALPGMLAQLSNWPGSTRRDMFIRILLEQWAQVNPKAALTALGDAVDRESATGIELENSILRGWITKDPEAAWAYAVGSLATNGALSLTGRGPGRGGSARLSELLVALSEAGQPTVAAGLLARPAPPNASEGQFVQDFISSWVQSAPMDAALFVESLPANVTRANGQSALMRGLLKLDRNLAAQYLVSRPSPDDIARLIFAALANAQGNGDEGAMVRWVDSAIGRNDNGKFDDPLLLAGFREMRFQTAESAAMPVEYELLIAKIKDPAKAAEAALRYVSYIRSARPGDAARVTQRYLTPPK